MFLSLLTDQGGWEFYFNTAGQPLYRTHSLKLVLSSMLTQLLHSNTHCVIAIKAFMPHTSHRSQLHTH
ncbi:hypothetical protein XENTR_v10022005 [Xenopus tropicalis]|nr:hypothetical protein XENTR_v10022005 [Xenopus tropicalis]